MFIMVLFMAQGSGDVKLGLTPKLDKRNMSEFRTGWVLDVLEF